MGKNKNNNLLNLQLTKDLTITEIEYNTFLVTHTFPWPANSLIIIVDNNNILWIDTPYTPEATSLVLDWIYNKFGEDYSIIEINTGFHIDNLGGNRELITRNIPIYGSLVTCELLKTGSTHTMSKLVQWLDDPLYIDVYSNFEFFCPTVTFDINEEQKIKLGKEEVIIYYPGPTHTYDNLVIYIPGKKLLFGGCMILAKDANKAGFIEDGNVHEWADSLLNLEKRFKNIRVVIPGHGDPGTSSLITHTKEIIGALISNE